MKKILFLLFCLTVGLGSASAQTKADTVKVQVKIKLLKQTEATLKKCIETEDKKRKQNIEGVSETSMDVMNQRQDSICLDLRSQLVDVQLQIRELELSIKPDATLAPGQAAANLHQGLATIPAAANNNPGRPTKPSKNTKK